MTFFYNLSEINNFYVVLQHDSTVDIEEPPFTELELQLLFLTLDQPN
jgi:hypothetical protein